MTMPETVSFHQMDEGTEDDYALLHKQEQNFITTLPSRIVSALENLEHSLSGYQVSRLEHSLQTATRAEQGGADKELVVAALIHDIGDDLAPENHSQMAAAIIRPYVRAEVTWILEMHGVFQMYYYADKIGLNKHERDRWRDHHWFGSCEKFCRDWDQVSFDPSFPSKPLDYFIPLIYEIFSRPAFSPDIISSDT
ncbi:MAG: HD domain-containing protein [Alphaproteobacteria bacterium]|nr:HD domain-containing protein [Alphaproteobacteria bacterium]